MKEVTVVFPHQLFEDAPALEHERTVYLVEAPFFLHASSFIDLNWHFIKQQW